MIPILEAYLELQEKSVYIVYINEFIYIFYFIKK